MPLQRPRPSAVLLLAATLLLVASSTIAVNEDDFTTQTLGTQDTSIATEPFADVTEATNEVAYACFHDEAGGGVRLFSTDDGGTTWTDRGTALTDVGQLRSCRIDALDADHITIGVLSLKNANQGLFISTSTNGGSSFNQVDWVNTSSTRADFENHPDIHFIDTSTIIAMFQSTGDDGPDPDDCVIARSTDSGISWTVHGLNIPDLNGVSCMVGPIDTESYVAIWERQSDDDPFFNTTSDGGQTWTTGERIDTETIRDISDIAIKDATTWGTVWQTNPNFHPIVWYGTTDAGSSWTKVQITLNSTDDFDRRLVLKYQDETDEWITAFAQETGNCSDCLVVANSTDTGATWTVERFDEIKDINGVGADFFGIGGYIFSGTEADNDMRVWTSSGEAFFPENVEPFNADQTATGYTDIIELRSTNDLNTRKVWARERDNGGTDQRAIRFSEALSEEVNVGICTNAGDWAQGTFNTYRESVAVWGLTVTHGDYPIIVCESTNSGDTTLHRLLKDGSWDPEQGVADLGAVLNAMPLDSKTFNEVLHLDELSGAAHASRVDLATGTRVSIEWETDDIAVGHGQTGWSAIVGQSGTRVLTRIGSSSVAPTLSVNHGSVQIHNNTLFTADDDTIHRYTITVGEALNETHTRADLDPINRHALRLSKDGQYLAVRTSTNITLLDAADLTTLGITNITLDPTTMEIDVLNNYLYVASDDDATGGADTIHRFPIFNVTVNSEGGGLSPGDPNPTPSQQVVSDTEGGTSGGTDPGAGPQVGDGFAASLQQTAADGFGVNQVAAGWILATMTILGMTGGLVLLAARANAKAAGFAGMGGGFAGVALSVGLGWIPLWFVVVMGLIAAAILTVKNS